MIAENKWDIYSKIVRCGGGGSPSGHYDAKWRPIKCPDCGSKNIRSRGGHSDTNFECNKCGHDFH